MNHHYLDSFPGILAHFTNDLVPLPHPYVTFFCIAVILFFLFRHFPFISSTRTRSIFVVPPFMISNDTFTQARTLVRTSQTSGRGDIRESF